jgi:SAM-dependent methyltransferase
VLAALSHLSPGRRVSLESVSMVGKPRLIVPDSLNRNSAKIAHLAPEHTGQILIDLALQRLSLKDLSETDVLDVGCGVRFTQTIINRDLSIKSYTGVDVSEAVIDYLKREVKDPRFRFYQWDVHNAMYRPDAATKMSPESRLPADGAYDVIWLFSVFTHLAPDDAGAMLAILRRHIRAGGRLLLSAFIEKDIETFEDRDEKQPLCYATYGETYFCQLIAQNGWTIQAAYPRDPDRFVHHQFVCTPAESRRLRSDAF